MKICFISGVFDVLHEGHRNIFNYGYNNYDKCIICVTTDKFAESYKRKPYDNQYKRKQNILDLGLFDENNFDWEADNQLELYDKWNITHILHGDDWEPDIFAEHMGGKEGIKSRNIQLDLVPHTKGINSTMLLKEKGYID